jgi:hypothetical protein
MGPIFILKLTSIQILVGILNFSQMDTYFPPLRFPSIVPEEQIRSILSKELRQNIIERIEQVGDKKIVHLLQTPRYNDGIHTFLDTIEQYGCIMWQYDKSLIEVGYADNNFKSVRKFAPQATVVSRIISFFS